MTSQTCIGYKKSQAPPLETFRIVDKPSAGRLTSLVQEYYLVFILAELIMILPRLLNYHVTVTNHRPSFI